MSAAPLLEATPVAEASAPQRITSIDIFRGLTMMVMIFVNEVAGVQGLPRWTYHAHAQEDYMTYVDMVFPFFLFIVGMAMPLAIERRLQRNPSYGALWLHIASRAAGLIVLGLILANAGKADPGRMGISAPAWALLSLGGAVLFWLSPGRDARRQTWFHILKALGLVLLLASFAIFRRTTADGRGGWIDDSYPEILGLIGYAYLSVALLYVPTRRWLWAPFAWLVALTTLCALHTAHLVHVLDRLPVYLWPFGSGASASSVMAGVATSVIFLGAHRWVQVREKLLLAGSFAALMFAAAALLTPLGISKIRATPTWCLASAGASVLGFALLYWICDVKGSTRWARVVRSAGENTLLTYLLPDMYYYLAALAGMTYFGTHWVSGAPGVVKAGLFTLLVLGISTLLTRCRVRLHL